MSADPGLLFLDVDGPLNPFAAKPEKRPAGYTTHRMRPSGWERSAKALRVWLKPDHGPALLRLAASTGLRLVWASTWGSEANEFIAPVLGLPELPWVDPAGWDAPARAEGVFVKTPDVIAYAAGRPFAWVDDLITGADEAYVARHHPGDALLLRIDPRRGLQDEDLAAVLEWRTPT